ncbi:Gamma-tubulin complex component 4 [Apiospora arundinis]
MSLFLSGVTWMNLSLLPFSSYQRLNPQLVHDHPTLQAMSSFNEDIDEGPNLHEELPFWQEELSSSSFSSSSSEDGTKEYERSDGGSVGSDNKIFSNKASYPGQRGRISNYPTRGRPRDWHPKERQLPLKFKARSVSPHTAWRAEVDWQTFIKFGSEARSTNWIGDPFYPKDKSIFELRGKPSSRRFKDTPRRNSMPTVSAAVPGSSPAIPERPSLALRSWEKVDAPSSTIDEVIPPTKNLCKACLCINPQSLKYGLAHHRLDSLNKSARSCPFCVFLQEHISAQFFMSRNEYQLTMDYRRVGLFDLETRKVIHEKPWDVFTKALDPAVEYGFNYMRQLTTTRSEESFAVARAWLADCILGHGKEPRPKTNSGPHPAKVRPKVPRRLIDVVNKTGQPGEVSLVQPQLSGIYEYAALTYCWGQVQGATWLTTKANLVSRSAGFIRSSMPQTLQDALIVTEKLGLRYVWIDALCIVQDDPEDWEVEGSKMAADLLFPFGDPKSSTLRAN